MIGSARSQCNADNNRKSNFCRYWEKLHGEWVPSYGKVQYFVSVRAPFEQAGRRLNILEQNDYNHYLAKIVTWNISFYQGELGTNNTIVRKHSLAVQDILFMNSPDHVAVPL